MKLPPAITWLQYAFANALIVILLPLLALQGMPPIDWLWGWANPPAKEEPAEVEAPLAAGVGTEIELEEEEAPPLPRPVADWLATKMTPVANVTGVATTSWSMFAPIPDSSNHRLRAKIEYRDGTLVEWRSPDWPELSCWQRFWTSRELEYIDKLAYFGSPERRNAFADYLAAENRRNPQPEGEPKRVTFVIEEAIITNPNHTGWVPMSEPIPRARNDVLTPKRVYPVPLELLKKQSEASVGKTSP